MIVTAPFPEAFASLMGLCVLALEASDAFNGRPCKTKSQVPTSHRAQAWGRGQRARLSPGQSGGGAQEGQAPMPPGGPSSRRARAQHGAGGPRWEQLQAPSDPPTAHAHGRRCVATWRARESLVLPPSVPAPGPGPPCPAESPQGQLVPGGDEAGEPGARVPGGGLLVRGGPRSL